MALGVLAVESAVARHPREVLNETAANYRFAARSVEGAARSADVLIFGDSQLKFGLLPKVVAARTGRRAFNLAIVGGQPPSAYFLLRRALDAGAHPSAIVLNAKPNVLAIDPRENARNTPELLGPAEVADLALAARDPDYLVRQLLAIASPTIRARVEVRRAVKDAFRPPKATRREAIDRVQRNWRVNGGAMVAAKNRHYGGGLTTAEESAYLPRSWRCDPLNRAYLRRFLDLAASRGIAVCWVIPPIVPEAQRRREAADLDARYTEFVVHNASRYPNVTVIDARHSAYPADVFIDPGHLDRDGASAFTAAVSTILRRGVEKSPRWVDLPTIIPAVPGVAMEDLDESKAALADQAARVRR